MKNITFFAIVFTMVATLTVLAQSTVSAQDDNIPHVIVPSNVHYPETDTAHETALGSATKEATPIAQEAASSPALADQEEASVILEAAALEQSLAQASIQASQQTSAQAAKQNRPFGERPVSFGLRVGMNVHRISERGRSRVDYAQTVGFHAGVVLDARLAKNFYLQPGLLFTTRGGMTKSRYTQTVGNDVYEFSQKLTPQAYYLELPLVFQYRFPISPKSSISIEAGAWAAVGLDGETKFELEGDINDALIVDTFYSDVKNTPDETFGLKRFDAGLRFGAGFHIHRFYIGMNYNLGLFNTAHGDIWQETLSDYGHEAAQIRLTNSSLSITAGVNF